MKLDYTYTDLTDDEILQREAREREQKKLDDAKEKARWAKARNFRFTGGLC